MEPPPSPGVDLGAGCGVPPGTPEDQWASWYGPRHLPPVPPPGEPVVVVAAHPGDEVLGFGGSLAVLAADGAEVHIVSVTDGEGSPPRSTLDASDEPARVRHRELLHALVKLGLPEVRVERLRIPDTRVDPHQGTVARAIAGLLREVEAARCVAPWVGDLHADHEAAGRAAVDACRATGVPLWMYPVWMWHWARPEDPRVPWHLAAHLPLPPEATALKSLAIAEFVSQIRPSGNGAERAAILPPDEVAHHIRSFEVVFR
ncbi:PIG-L deacetylase family protein [Streptomyces noursei]|uniref:PIG-L deacetylase family protein n=1 Tax=Streptomyces noursei TaxID=1971 RepID=UPI001F2E34D4|nr:PIG-L family deacetylase [Streptomyces noursei]MCE4941524.1 PIG-L family deacetylase [Streptomyces noursei]